MADAGHGKREQWARPKADEHGERIDACCCRCSRPHAPSNPDQQHSVRARANMSPRLSSTARATFWAASPASLPSSSSTARRSLSSAARPSTSLASSSALSVRLPPSTSRSDWTRLAPTSRSDRWTESHETETDSRTVKYHAYLRKMTRYNPTRGGESDPDRLGRRRALLLTADRSLPLPRSLPNLLQGRPWHDPPQDRPWCRRS